MVRADILIRGGTIVDPARELLGQGDVLIRGDKIVESTPGEDVLAEGSIDATGCLVTPGLIDNHAHVFYGGTAVGCQPDTTLLPMGVTTVGDAGSAGVETAVAFIRSVVQQSRMRIFCTLNVSSEGQTTSLHTEDLNPERYDRERLAYFLEKYPGIIKGLKVRCSIDLVGRFGMSVLTGALEAAQSLGCPLTVHTTNPPCDMGDLAAMLRPGDTLCHPFHGTGNTIIDASGRVKAKAREARRKGVLFDTADGRFNHSYPVIKAALADGFVPDMISSDLTLASAFGDVVFGLPVVMSKYLTFGLPLLEVVRACTATPAATLGLAGKIGTLAPGAKADVAVLVLKSKERRLRNPLGETMVVPKQLVPQMTILDGRIVFRLVDFC